MYPPPRKAGDLPAQVKIFLLIQLFICLVVLLIIFQRAVLEERTVMANNSQNTNFVLLSSIVL